MQQRLEIAETTSRNSQRARQNALHKLKYERNDKSQLAQRLAEVETMRTDMQTRRDKAEASRHLMEVELEEMQELRRKLADVEAARDAAEARCEKEQRYRRLAEKQRQEALVLAQKMRKERDVALQKAIAANERLKDGVGSCLSLSMEQTTEQARLHLAMEDLEGRVHSKEKEITNLMQTGGKALTASSSSPSVGTNPASAGSYRSSSSLAMSGSAIAQLCATRDSPQTQNELVKIQASAMENVLGLSSNRNGPE
jgi:hypothetical protein